MFITNQVVIVALIYEIWTQLRTDLFTITYFIENNVKKNI